MEIEKPKRKQICFDVNPDIHKKVKAIAIARNISMCLWVQRALIEKLEREKIVHQET
jgi:predicted HicB family RNase H-like nuclease